MREIKESRLKYICSSFASNISTDLLTDEETQESKYMVYGASGLVGFYITYYSSCDYLGIIKDGAGVGRINKYPKHSSILGTMAYIIPNKGVDIDWLKYCVSALNLSGSLDKTTIPHIYFSDYGNRTIKFFDLHEQQRIANFLDIQCNKIDDLMSDVQSQIETLEEYKKSVISEAVTKGLNSNVEMKDTLVKWIPKSPKGWLFEKAKYCFATRNTKGNKINLELLSPTQKYGVIPQKMYEEISSMVAVKVNDTTNLMTFKTIHKGDYCISLRSFEGGFEYSEFEGVVSPAYTVLYPSVECNKAYYKYLFKIKSFIYEMNSYSLSLRDGKPISFNDFGNTYIPIPPIEEQTQIAYYLDLKCAEIDSVISDKKAQLETLEEYKKSLIYEYVTGKKEVPNE